MSKVAELLKTYTYNASKPVFAYNGLSVYDAESKENSLKFTIKIMKRSDADVASYLQKLKSAAS
jgi:sulfur carrier protein ThiS